jgi:hypothetical protein
MMEVKVKRYKVNIEGKTVQITAQNLEDAIEQIKKRNIETATREIRICEIDENLEAYNRFK